MYRLFKVTLVLVILCSLMVTPVFAANPHFVGQVRFTDNGTTLTASGSIAGLGNQNIDVVVEAVGTATIECTNPGGNVAPGQTTTVSASGSQQDIAVKNGRASFNITTVAPAAPNPAVVCPNPQWSAAITDVAFTSVTITVYQPAGSGIQVLQQTFQL
jgi:K+-transporting ATPase c subunit